MLFPNVRYVCWYPHPEIQINLIPEHRYHFLSMENKIVVVGNVSPPSETCSGGPSSCPDSADCATTGGVSVDESVGEGCKRKWVGLLNVSDVVVQKRLCPLEPSNVINSGLYCVIYQFIFVYSMALR